MPMVMLGAEAGDIVEPTESHGRMFSYGKEVCFLLALLFTSYAALHNPLPRVYRAPAPVRFFRQNSVVDDFYMGNLNAALEQITVADLSFVMYYAPWDAESQKVRWHFEAASRYYHGQVYFAAINCWQPESECRQQYSKIPNFPVLMLYPQQHSGLQYRGIREVSHMIRFLRTALKPLTRLVEPHDLLWEMAKHDAVVVGFFDLNTQETLAEYEAFHDAAINFLEQDNLQEISFAVVTNGVTAKHFQVEETPSIRLYLWNESLSYVPSWAWSAESITSWVTQNLHQVAVWVQPPGIKSLTLSAYVQEGPVLLLFTPRNPLLSHMYYYDLLREVALEFFNCNNSVWVNQLNDVIWDYRHETSSKYEKLLGDCADWRKLRGHVGGVAPVLTESSVYVTHWTNSSVCESEPQENLVPPRGSYDHGYCGLLNYDSDILKSSTGSSGSMWSNYLSLKKKVNSGPTDARQRKRLRLGMQEGTTSMLSGDNDNLWAEELTRKAKDEQCRELRHARLLDKPYYPEPENISLNNDSESEHKSKPNVHGLARKTNHTLSFLAMDSLQLHQFAEGLGVDVLRWKGKTAVLIISPQQESQYLLDGEVNKRTLVEFIKGYVENTLPRWKRTTSVEPRTDGFSFGPTQTLHLNRYAERAVRECPSNMVCVPEISSSTFSTEILKSEKNVVLMYHTPYCVFCHAASHVFLTVAHTLRTMSTVKFARIDGDNNDLPWEFTMYRFPSILFFPAHHKGDSRIFPAHLQVTVPNLAQFVLSNLTPEERIVALLVICEQGSGRRPLSYQDQSSIEKCLAQVRVEALQSASVLLGRYRSSVALAARHNSLQSQASHTLRSYIQHLTVRLRFLRVSAGALAPPVQSTHSLLTQMQEAFTQHREALAENNAKHTVVKDEL